MSDYQRGWFDCRAYKGEAANQSEAYHRGFRDCLKAYHVAKSGGNGWNDVLFACQVSDPETR